MPQTREGPPDRDDEWEKVKARKPAKEEMWMSVEMIEKTIRKK